MVLRQLLWMTAMPLMDKPHKKKKTMLVVHLLPIRMLIRRLLPIRTPIRHLLPTITASQPHAPPLRPILHAYPPAPAAQQVM
jgi:hypothetical protein